MGIAKPADRTVDDNRRSLSLHSLIKAFWGRLYVYELPERISTFGFVLAAIACLSFTQLGFWSIGIIDSNSVYIMMVLAPLAMGALLLGPIGGAVVGLFTGCVVFAHAIFLPLDGYEVYFMTPLNTFVMLAFIGALGGFLFFRALDGVERTAARAVRIAVVCAITSVVATLLVLLNTLLAYASFEELSDILQYLTISPVGMALQAFIDAVVMFACCLIADAFVRKTSTSSSDRTLLTVFRYWLFVVSAIVFMLASGFFLNPPLQCAPPRATVSPYPTYN